MADHNQWFYQIMGETFGPVSPSELRQLAQASTISVDTLVRKGADGDWVRAERVKGLWGPAKEPAPSRRREERSSPIETANRRDKSQVQPGPMPSSEMRTHETGEGTFDDVQATVGSDRGKTVQAGKWRGKKKVCVLGGIVILVGTVFVILNAAESFKKTRMDRFSEFADMVSAELPNVSEIDLVVDVYPFLGDGDFVVKPGEGLSVKDHNMIRLAFETVETDRELTVPARGTKENPAKVNVSPDEHFWYEALYQFENDRWVLRDVKKTGSTLLWGVGHMPDDFTPSAAIRALLERSEEY